MTLCFKYELSIQGFPKLCHLRSPTRAQLITAFLGLMLILILPTDSTTCQHSYSYIHMWHTCDRDMNWRQDILQFNNNPYYV